MGENFVHVRYSMLSLHVDKWYEIGNYKPSLIKSSRYVLYDD